MTSDTAAAVAAEAVRVARALRALNRERVELAPEPVYPGAVVGLGLRDGPVPVATADKVALLGDWSRRLLDADGRRPRHRELPAGQGADVLRDSPGRRSPSNACGCIRNSRPHPSTDAGTFETMRTLAPPVGRVGSTSPVRVGVGPPNWPRSPAAGGEGRGPERRGRPDRPRHRPTNLWLTIHESVGHATSTGPRHRVRGGVRGTSFATPDMLGTLQYGTPLMHVTADRTERHGLAERGYDDDAVAA
ncbi:TldD/PmbA family protein, partial [Rhodococcus hoagii]|nr:TldD/PmbA family protein [Prescottella equi]